MAEIDTAVLYGYAWVARRKNAGKFGDSLAPNERAYWFWGKAPRVRLKRLYVAYPVDLEKERAHLRSVWYPLLVPGAEVTFVDKYERERVVVFGAHCAEPWGDPAS